ncbi:pre-peptidase C-terminal domain-containing protein [Cupriavidus metallidurans]|uniref:Curculin-like (Mannose-binding) lectin n=1 Tax=Cupriavidus metallidurans (strain ATCC 43123 / DSM 2839 / NBRC 102507 / CH34) TaxID=266264 RepID=Q1LEK9_CUPMC|nr:pre-peptidase C-terminal domain-containing protein [Cupriavidus metallidurans]ABF11417.1 putative Curculin-like (mannose-binding) lectin [Cupriavidus metallidurans CH34]QGS33323.1 Curculin-like (mannose-binding) lectin [Cupriavidus metallidurans]
MKKHPRRVFQPILLICVAAVLSACGGDDGGDGSATASGSPSNTARSVQYYSGQKAIDHLGNSLSEFAVLHGMTAEELRQKLLTDPTLFVTSLAKLVYRDNARQAQVVAPNTLSRLQVLTESSSADPGNVFALHSRSGSTKTIYLNFKGGTLRYPTAVPPIVETYPAFDLDGDPSTFNTEERLVIQEVFRRVAEDFAIFDVDVTTEEPARDKLVRADAQDGIYGQEIYITRDIYSVDSGGEAPIGVFNSIDTPGQPDQSDYNKAAKVFYDKLAVAASDRAAVIADAISHETGHTLGLSHMGTATATYYPGDSFSSWLPLMSQHPNANSIRKLTTWSHGDYKNANNHEDELAIINAYGLKLISDDFGDTIGAAFPLGIDGTNSDGRPSSRVSGIIGSSTDSDMFRITVPEGPLTIQADPAAVGPNLDIKLSLLDSAGNSIQIVKDNPTTADSLSAGIALPQIAAGTYYVKVEGTGRGSPLTPDPKIGLPWGYTKYGSLGSYTLAVIYAPVLAADQISTLTKERTQAMGFNISLLSPGAWNVFVSAGTSLVKSYGGASGAALTDAAILPSGAKLNAGESLRAGGMTLTMQADGNLVIYDAAHKVLFASTTNSVDNQGSALNMQADGNLVIRNPAGKSVWASGTDDFGGEYMVFGSDGTLSLRTGSRINWLLPSQLAVLTSAQVSVLSAAQIQGLDTAVNNLSSDALNFISSLGSTVVKRWGGVTGVALTEVKKIAAGGKLNSGVTLTAGSVSLVMQGDGNLVIYDTAHKAVWASNTNSVDNQGAHLNMQATDGNLVMYTPAGKAIWASNTNDNRGEFMVFGSDACMSLQTGSRVSWFTAAQVQSLTQAGKMPVAH